MLEAYLNLVFFRREYQGVGAACRALFGKAPHGMNAAESLVLAALIRSPNADQRPGGRPGGAASEGARLAGA